MAGHPLAFDLGTGGNKASLYDAEGRLLAPPSFPTTPSIRSPAGTSSGPTIGGTRSSGARGNSWRPGRSTAASIRGMAISGHSLGCVPLDSRGPDCSVQSTPIWSDKRPVAQAARFLEKVDPNRWYRLTGNGFPAAALHGLQAPLVSRLRAGHVPSHPQGDRHQRLHQLPAHRPDRHRLSPMPRAAEFTTCSVGITRTRLLAAADLPRALFPEIVPSTEILGRLTTEAAEVLGLPRDIPVACGGVDNSCMALGARNTAEGRVYASLGSSMWIAVSSHQPLLDNAAKPYVFTHVVPGMFTSAVSIFSGGSSLRWVRINFAKSRGPGRRPKAAILTS